MNLADVPPREEQDSRPPALKEGRILMEDVQIRMTQLAIWHTQDKTPYWTKIHQILKLAADLWEMEMHAIALPYDRNSINKWDFISNKWRLPPIRMNTGLQKIVKIELEKLYEEVMAKHYGAVGVRFVPWKGFLKEWVSLVTFFFHYWHLKRDLSQQEAYAEAVKIGSKEVKCAKDTKTIIQALLKTSKRADIIKQVESLLQTRLTNKPTEDAPDSSLGNPYFTFSNERKVSRILIDFLNVVDTTKVKVAKDVIKATRLWWKGYQIHATNEEQDTLGSLQQIYSSEEVHATFDTFKKKEEERSSESEDDSDYSTEEEKSSESDDDTEKDEDEQDSANERADVKNDNNKPSRKSIAPSENDTNLKAPATSKIDQEEESNIGGTAFQPGMAKEENSKEETTEESAHDKADASNEHAKVKTTTSSTSIAPSEEAPVNSSVDQEESGIGGTAFKPGMAKEENSRKEKMTMASLTKEAACDQADTNNEQAKIKTTTSSTPVPAAVQASSKTLTSSTPIPAALPASSEITGLLRIVSPPTKQVTTTIPPIIGKDMTTFPEPGSQSHEKYLEAYSMIINFVNDVQIRGVTTPAFQFQNGRKPDSLPLHNTAALAMMALDMHDVDRMGNTLHDFHDSLKTWVPALYQSNCGKYLAAFYQILTLQDLLLEAKYAPATSEEVNAICVAVEGKYSSAEKMKFEIMKNQILQTQDKVQKGLLQSPVIPCLLEKCFNGKGTIPFFPSLTGDTRNLIQQRSTGNTADIIALAYIGGDTGGNKVAVKVIRKSFQTLHPQQWLNDEVINFYTCALCRKKSPTHATVSKYKHCYSSHFMAVLMQDRHASLAGVYNYAGVQKWGAKVPGGNIFAFSKLAIPINYVQLHWALVVVDMKEHSVQCYDSCGNNGDRFVQHIFQYLQDEHYKLFGSGLPYLQNWKIQGKTPKNLPRQKNSYDCGVYCCSYIEFLFDNLSIPTNQVELDNRRLHIAQTILQPPIPYMDEANIKEYQEKQEEAGRNEKRRRLVDVMHKAKKKASVGMMEKGDKTGEDSENSDDNSVEVIEMGKALETTIKDKAAKQEPK
jgi:sentrin-specific protease 1